MGNLNVDDEAMFRLQDLAAKERRSVSDMLLVLLANYEAQSAKSDPLADFLDVFSGKELDMTKSVKAMSENHYRKKYGDSD